MLGRSLCLLTIFLTFFYIASAEDMECVIGKQKKKIVLGPGKSFSFSTAGETYAPKLKCTANYKRSKKCKQAKISCSKFETIANSQCKGDFLMVKLGKAKTKYCGTNGPDVVTTSKKFQLLFSSNKKKEGAGVECTVQCNDPAPVIPNNPECSKYNNLTYFRNVNDGRYDENGKLYCDTLDNPLYESPDWQGEGWYRFTGASGHRMPTASPGEKHCGASFAGWLAVPHPQMPGDTVPAAKVCFHWGNKQCFYSLEVAVTNCNKYFVYELKQTPWCNARYCATNDSI